MKPLFNPPKPVLVVGLTASNVNVDGPLFVALSSSSMRSLIQPRRSVSQASLSLSQARRSLSVCKEAMMASLRSSFNSSSNRTIVASKAIFSKANASYLSFHGFEARASSNPAIRDSKDATAWEWKNSDDAREEDILSLGVVGDPERMGIMEEEEGVRFGVGGKEQRCRDEAGVVMGVVGDVGRL